MEPIHRRLMSFIFAVCLASAAFAQDRQPDQTAPKAETALPASGPLLTGKERTGRKWMDEQRIAIATCQSTSAGASRGRVIA